MTGLLLALMAGIPDPAYMPHINYLASRVDYRLEDIERRIRMEIPKPDISQRVAMSELTWLRRDSRRFYQSTIIYKDHPEYTVRDLEQFYFQFKRFDRYSRYVVRSGLTQSYYWEAVRRFNEILRFYNNGRSYEYEEEAELDLLRAQ